MDADGSAVAIRPARDDDAAAVAEIWLGGWHDAHDGLVPQAIVDVRTPESFRTRAAERVTDTTVATVGGEVAGFVMLAGDELEQMYVSSAHRGTGIAHTLITDAERQLRELGHTRTWLAVVAGNARARAFYERAGWVDEGPFDYAARVGERTIHVPCHRYAREL